MSSFGLGLLAQQQPAVFERLGTGMDGFPDERFGCLLRGSYGFMWLGSARGLLRYDGSATRWYRHDSDDPGSIASGNIRVLFEDRDRNFWVGANGGLCLLERRTGRFTHFRNDPHDPTTLSHDNVWSLFQDKSGALWVGSADGLNRKTANGFERFGQARGLGSSGITAIAEDGRGRLWVGSERDGLRRYDAEGNRFLADAGVGAQKIRVLHRDADGRLWVGSLDEGAFVFDPSGSDWRAFRHDPEDPGSIGGDQVTAIASGEAGDLWLGTSAGLNRFLAEENRFQRFQHDPANLESLRDNGVTALHRDGDGLLWAATTGAGVDIYNLKRARFSYYALEGNECWAVYRAGSGPIWVGTKNGLAQMDPETGESRWRLADRVIRSLHPAPGGGFYLGTDRELLQYEPEKEDSEPVILLSGYRIWRILADGRGDLWLATNQGLLHFSPASGAMRRYISDPREESSLGHNVVSSLALEASGALWAGTFGGGVSRLDPETGAFQRYRHIAGEPNSLAADDVVDLHFDARGNLWVGTLSGGLNRLDLQTGAVTRHTLKSGFPDNAAVAVQSDGDGALWVHTGVGLLRLDAESGDYIHYRAYDGVAVGSAIPGACFRDPYSGEMLLGGASGLIRFQPETLEKPKPPEVIFTLFAKGGRDVAHMLLPGESVHLDRSDRSFSLKFAVLDFLSRQNQRFAYRRGKIDDDWAPSEGEGQVAFTRYLSLGGEDQLRVRGSNGNGLWGEARLSISLEPPLWISWLPLILVLGLAALVGLVYAAVSFRERRKRLLLEAKARRAEEKRGMAEERARIAERRQELARRERQLQVEHSRILQDHLERVSTEIANNLHDGPLSELHGLGFRMMALSREGEEPNRSLGLQGLAQESLPKVCQHLRNICGDLLTPDFRGGLATELDAYADVIEAMSPGLRIERELPAADDALSEERKAILYRIFRTLLKNVGKHAHATRASIRFETGNGELRLRIEDNGRGFQAPEDWEAFKRKKHYGMYMADYFTRTLGGRFQVESSPGKGTRITVTAPLE